MPIPGGMQKYVAPYSVILLKIFMKKNILWSVMTMMSLYVYGQAPADSLYADSIRHYELAEINVSANRVSSTTPMAYSAIDENQIKENNYGRDIPYLLEGLPSVVAMSDAGNGIGYTDIRMRGYDGTRINVTTNGVPMNDAESHKVYWVNTPDLMSSMGNIQVVRGAGASTNGTGAFGGAINMTTDNIPAKFGGEVDLSYGSFNTNKEAVRISSGLLGGHWAIDGKLSHIYSDGYMERATSDLFSYMLQAGYYSDKTIVKLLSFGGKEQTYNAWDGITKEQMQENRRYNPCGAIEDKDGNVIGFYENQKDNYLQINNQLQLTHNINHRWDFNATLHYTYGNGYYDQYKNARTLEEYKLTTLLDKNGTLLEESNLIRQKHMFNHFGGLVSSANYKNNSVDLSIGAAWSTYGGDHFGKVIEVADAVNFTNPTEYYRNSSLKHDGNIYAKVNWEAFKGFHLYGDIQYRYVNQKINGYDDVYDYSTGDMLKMDLDKHFHFINPKVGILYDFCDYHRVYASLAMAGREPTRKDFTNAPIGMQPKAEHLLDLEFGYQVEHKYIKLGLNFYYMWYKDQLILTGEQNPDTYEALYMNVPESYRRGIELTVSSAPLSWFTISANATLSQNKIVDYTEYVYNDDTYTTDAFYIGESTIAYSPSVIAGISLDFHTHGFAGIWRTQYVGKQYITNGMNENLSLDPYCVSSVDLSYKLALPKDKFIRFGVQINNLFNTMYAANAFAWSGIYSGERYDEAYYLPQAGINALGNIRFEF